MPRRVTVTEVAQRAGVSVASVSRVLNGIAARRDTEERVRRAAEELGYVPDAAAKALKLGRPLQLAIAVDDIANPVYALMMHGVEAGLLGSGSRLLVSSTGRRPADLLELVEGLSRGYADGLIISPLRRTPELIDALAQAPVPVVVIGDIGDDDRLDQVRTDSALGVAMADDFTVEAGEAAWPEVAATGGRRIDAVIAANDLVALGLARAALDAGRRVPGSLAIVGVDDIGMASIFRPSLTSVSLGAHERGRLAAELLLRRLEHPGAAVETRFVSPRLVVRESTATPSTTSDTTKGDA